MLNLGLTSTERGAYERALRSSHTRKISVLVLDLEERVQADLSDRLVDGQVVVDMDAEVTRAASLTLLDPDHSLNFDTDSPDDGALYADRMLKIDYSVRVDSLGRHVPVTIFTGPVAQLSRDGIAVQIEAQSKETLARGAIWTPLVLKKGTRQTEGIETILRDRTGERRLSILSQPDRLAESLSLGRYAEAWAEARKIADGLDLQLFYSAEGVATLREFPSKAVYTFRTGTGGDVLTKPQVSHTLEDLKNAVRVLGGKPKGAKKRVEFLAVAPDDHPLSPGRLGRNGRRRYLVETIEDEKIRTKVRARAKAERTLEDRLRDTLEVTFDALPIPHLEPGDLVAVETDDFTAEFRLRKFSIPLAPTGAPPMPVGYTKKTTVRSTLRRSLRA